MEEHLLQETLERRGGERWGGEKREGEESGEDRSGEARASVLALFHSRDRPGQVPELCMAAPCWSPTGESGGKVCIMGQQNLVTCRSS